MSVLILPDEAVKTIEKQDVPPEYRIYISHVDASMLPKGIKVYRGPKGGLYVDRREIIANRLDPDLLENFPPPEEEGEEGGDGKPPKSDFPEWFPDWLYEEATAEELERYRDWITSGVVGPDDIVKIPDKVYHATPHADAIMKEGFKTAKELGVSGFGGHGSYVSFTTLENARIYQENMRMACRILNGAAKLADLRDWVKKMLGTDGPFAGSFEMTMHQYLISHPDERGKAEREGMDYGPFNAPSFIWEVFKHLFAFAPNDGKIVLFVGEPNLAGVKPEDIKIVEARPSPKLRFRPEINLYDEDMSDRYTYNKYEKEWRVWSGKNVSPVRIVGEEKGVAKQSEVPEEFRVYLSGLDPEKLPKGLTVYQGPRGGKFIDRRELEERGITEEDLKPDKPLEINYLEIPDKFINNFGDKISIFRSAETLYGHSEEFLARIFGEKAAKVISASLRACRDWCSGETEGIAAVTLDNVLKELRGNHRLARPKRFAQGKLKTATREDFITLVKHKAISEEIFREFYGESDYLYRGVGGFGADQIALCMATGLKPKLFGVAMSFTDDPKVARHFGVAIRAKINYKQVVAGWWFMHQPWNEIEREIVVEIPEGGLEVEPFESKGIWNYSWAKMIGQAVKKIKAGRAEDISATDVILTWSKFLDWYGADAIVPQNVSQTLRRLAEEQPDYFVTLIDGLFNVNKLFYDSELSDLSFMYDADEYKRFAEKIRKIAVYSAISIQDFEKREKVIAAVDQVLKKWNLPTFKGDEE